MFELLMLKKNVVTGGAISEDIKTDVSGLITKYQGAGSVQAINVSLGQSGCMAIYNNQLITIVNTAIKYYDINNSFALARSVTAAVNANIALNNAQHQSGSRFWVGQDRSNTVIYCVDLIAGSIKAYPSSPVKKGMFFASKGKLWLVGGWGLTDNVSNKTTVYSIDINNPTAWVAQSSRNALPFQIHGAVSYVTDNGLIAFTGGGMASSSTETDGGSYTSLIFLDPDSLTYTQQSLPSAIAGPYHNPNFIYGKTAYQFKYTNAGHRWPIGSEGSEANLSPAPIIASFHNPYTLAGRVAFYGSGYNTAPIYLYVLPI